MTALEELRKLEIEEITLSKKDIDIIKELYLQHHHGDCFNELFKLSVSGNKVLKVHSAIDVNNVFQFESHEYKSEWNVVEISWNRKTNEILQFFR